MNQIQEQQLKIYLYFCQADGKCTEDELDLYWDICSKMHVLKKDGKSVLNSVDFFSKEGCRDCQKIALTKIKQVLSSSAYFGISSNKSAQIETFWNLANLAYADTVFSESENLILKALQNEWKIPDDILLEFKDTAETILLLKKKEEWLKSIGGTPTYVEEQIAIVEKDIKRLMDYVKTTIKSA